MQGVSGVHFLPECTIFQTVLANVFQPTAAHFPIVRAGHFRRFQPAALPPMALAPHILHDVLCKARDVAMIEVQRFTTGHAAPAPRFLNHFSGQAINALHNDVVMVLSHPHPVNIRRVFMHDDPLRVPNAFFIAHPV